MRCTVLYDIQKISYETRDELDFQTSILWNIISNRENRRCCLRRTIYYKSAGMSASWIKEEEKMRQKRHQPSSKNNAFEVNPFNRFRIENKNVLQYSGPRCTGVQTWFSITLLYCSDTSELATVSIKFVGDTSVYGWSCIPSV